MPDDLLEALSACCGECFSVKEVAWCPAWNVYLCFGCRINRSDTEMRTWLAARMAATQAAREGQAS